MDVGFGIEVARNRTSSSADVSSVFSAVISASVVSANTEFGIIAVIWRIITNAINNAKKRFFIFVTFLTVFGSNNIYKIVFQLFVFLRLNTKASIVPIIAATARHVVHNRDVFLDSLFGS